jgi:flagellar hook-associated protein 3 FlgL
MIRFNPDLIPDMLRLLSQSQQRENTALQQLSTSRRVNVPSDNPAASAANIEDIARNSSDDQYIANVETLRELMNTGDSALSSIVTSLQRAISIGVEGANDTQTAETRAAIAEDVLGIKDQVLSLANLSFRGRYVFAGSATMQPPFVKDATSTSGVTYAGNAQINQVQVGDQRMIPTNLPGNTIFTSAGSDVFQALQSLADALKSNAGGTTIGDCVTHLREAFDHIGAQRVFYGNSMNQLDAEGSFLQNDKLLIAQHQNQTVAADPAKAASDFQQAQFAREATLQAVAKATGMSLFDYLR